MRLLLIDGQTGISDLKHIEIYEQGGSYVILEIVSIITIETPRACELGNRH